MKQLGDIELISGRIINLKPESVDELPTFSTDDESLIIYNTVDKSLYLNNGTNYFAIQIASENSEPVIESLGSNWFNDDRSFNPTPFINLPGSFFAGLAGSDSLFTVISRINTELIELGDITINDIQDFAVENPQAGDIIYFNGTNYINAALTSIPNLGINISLSDLTDVILPTTGVLIPIDNDVLFFDSSLEGGKFTNKRFFAVREDTGSHSSYTVTHNLGQLFCTVTVFDRATNTRLTPTSVSYTDTATLTIGLGSPPSLGIVVHISTIPVQN